MNIHVLPVAWSTHGDRLRAIREAVFINEQGVDRDLEWDGQDETAAHFIALDEAGRALGTGRLLEGGQIGRMAVLADQRGRGIGRRILDLAVEHAKNQGLTEVFLHAQADAVEFYGKAGFVTTGGTFMEAGIEHVSMTMQLPIPFEHDESTQHLEIVNPDEPLVQRGEAKIIQFDSEGDARASLCQVLEDARRTVDIQSPDLDHAMFGYSGAVDLLSQLARSGKPAHVRILIESSSRIVSRGHLLIELARRLPTKITILRIPQDLRQGRHAYVVVDEFGVWVQPDNTVYTGWANRNDPVEAMRLTGNFNYLYDRSLPDPELRRLEI
jgi:predicted GNAT family N-acyltransferase